MVVLDDLGPSGTKLDDSCVKFKPHSSQSLDQLLKKMIKNPYFEPRLRHKIHLFVSFLGLLLRETDQKRVIYVNLKKNGENGHFCAPVHATGPVPNISSCLLYTSPSPRDRTRSRMPSSA